MWRSGRQIGFLLLIIVLVLSGCQRAAVQDDMAQNGGNITTDEVSPSGENGLPTEAGSQAEAEQANTTETDGTDVPDRDLPSEEPAVEPRKEPVRIPVLIYQLTDDILQLPVSSIPYYDKGKIRFLSEEDIRASGKRRTGHQTGIDDVMALTSNLTGREDAELDWTASVEGERQTSEGLIMKETAERRYELFVPDVGRYEIELEAPPGHEVLYISKITWHPNRAAGTEGQVQSADLRAARSIVFYELPEDVFQRPRTSIPYYNDGTIEYLPEYVFEQYEEGHQPWLGTGIDVATVMTSNLAGQENPYLELSETLPGFHFKQSTPSGIVIQALTNEFIQLKVPEIGTYDIEMTVLGDLSFLMISNITLHLNEYS